MIKTESKDAIAGRIRLFQEVIHMGIETLIQNSKREA